MLLHCTVHSMPKERIRLAFEARIYYQNEHMNHGVIQWIFAQQLDHLELYLH